jgi:hypothetical protein
MIFVNLIASLVLALVLSACGSAGATDVSTSSTSEKEVKQTEGNGNTTRRAASSLPDLVEVQSIFDGGANPGKIEDEDESMVTWLMANISETRYSVPIKDFLYLGKASSKAFISPQPKGCKLTTYMFDYVGPANQVFNLGGRDAKGKKDCQNFLEAISRTGLQMEFTDVPLLNGRGVTIKKVRVTIASP